MKVDDVKKQIKKQDADTYGDADSPESDDDLQDLRRKTLGDDVDEGAELDLAKAIEGDEKKLRDIPPEKDEDKLEEDTGDVDLV